MCVCVCNNNFSLIRNKHIFKPIKILLNSSNQSPFYFPNVTYLQAVWCILILSFINWSDGVNRHGCFCGLLSRSYSRLCGFGTVLAVWFLCRLFWRAFRVCASEFGSFAFTAAAGVYRSRADLSHFLSFCEYLDT